MPLLSNALSYTFMGLELLVAGLIRGLDAAGSILRKVFERQTQGTFCQLSYASEKEADTRPMILSRANVELWE